MASPIPPAVSSILKAAAPILAAAATAWGTMSVERAENAQTRADVAEMKKQAVPDAMWKQSVVDDLKDLRRAMDRVEHAVGSK